MLKTKKIICIFACALLLTVFLVVPVSAETGLKTINIDITKAQVRNILDGEQTGYYNLSPTYIKSPYGGIFSAFMFNTSIPQLYDCFNANMYFDDIKLEKDVKYTFNFKFVLSKYLVYETEVGLNIFNITSSLCLKDRSELYKISNFDSMIGSTINDWEFKSVTNEQTGNFAFLDVKFSLVPNNDCVVSFINWFCVLRDEIIPSDRYFGISDFYIQYEYDGSKAVIDNANKNTSEIINNQNENADKITNNADKNASDMMAHNESMYENEKQETQNSGNDSIDSVANVIPSDNDGFISALNQFSSCLVSSSKQCRWNFPRVYLPAIKGVINKEVELIPPTKIDFNYWINKIPSNILNLIQILCTLALIVYCFKELYDTISYIMTLRKGTGE